MSITLSTQTSSVQLPPALQWVDEFSWEGAVTSIKYSVVGSVIAQQGIKQGGRKITLMPPYDENACWVDKYTADMVKSFERVPLYGLTLTLRGVSRVVVLDSVEFVKIVQSDEISPTDFYRTVKISLTEL